jgi:hypothetical protein
MYGITNDVKVDLNWGFDHVLGYWYDIIETRDGEEGIVEEWNSAMGGSRSKMLEFLIKYNCPEDHRSAVGLDMQF